MVGHISCEVMQFDLVMEATEMLSSLYLSDNR